MYEGFPSTIKLTLFISCGFCLLTMLVLNRINLVIVSIAVLCVGTNIATILGLTALMGWEQNELTALNYMAMFGVCVNAPLQMALSYNYCPYFSRFDKLAFAYKEKSSTIVASFFVHMVSAAVLFSCTLAHSTGFAVVVLIGGIISLLTGTMMFGALAHVLHPCLQKDEEEY